MAYKPSCLPIGRQRPSLISGMTRHRGLPAIVRVSINIVLCTVALQIATGTSQFADQVSSSHATSTAISLL